MDYSNPGAFYCHINLSPQIESTVNRTTFCSFRQLRKFYLCILVTQPTPRVTNAVKKRAKYGKKRDFQIQHGCRDCTLYLGTQMKDMKKKKNNTINSNYFDFFFFWFKISTFKNVVSKKPLKKPKKKRNHFYSCVFCSLAANVAA